LLLFFNNFSDFYNNIPVSFENCCQKPLIEGPRAVKQAFFNNKNQ